jgi:hypothetical protein
MPQTQTGLHEGNATPTASPDGIKRMDADTPHAQPGDAIDKQGVRVDTDSGEDPKSGGTPVHRAPSDESPQS